MAILGFIAGFVVLAWASLGIGCAILFGGEEFSPARGKLIYTLLFVAAGIIFLWFLLFTNSPFSISFQMQESP